MEKPPFAPVIRTQADLEEMWRVLMGPWGFGSPSLWVVAVLEDGTPLPWIQEIAGTESPPEAAALRRFVDFLTRLSEEAGHGARFAFLRSRPGSAGVTEPDREWAVALYDACRTAGVPAEIVHLATEGDVRPLPPDELALPATG